MNKYKYYYRYSIYTASALLSIILSKRNPGLFLIYQHTRETAVCESIHGTKVISTVLSTHPGIWRSPLVGWGSTKQIKNTSYRTSFHACSITTGMLKGDLAIRSEYVGKFIFTLWMISAVEVRSVVYTVCFLFVNKKTGIKNVAGKNSLMLIKFNNWFLYKILPLCAFLDCSVCYLI